MILTAAVIEDSQLRLYTEHEQVAQRMCDLFYDVFGAGSETSGKKGQGVVYKVAVRGEATVFQIRDAVLQKDAESGLYRFRVQDKLLQRDCCVRSILRGAFLASGFLADPNKNYHFEIATRHSALSRDFVDLFGHFGITAKRTMRKSSYVVYVKESEAIADAISVVGATRALMEFRNVQVYKDVRNQVNRAVNCETANVAKTVGAAAKQAQSIKVIERRMGLSNLPDDLQEVARVRLEHPEASLLDIARLLSVPLTKSGVNHRLKKIEKIAQELENK